MSRDPQREDSPGFSPVEDVNNATSPFPAPNSSVWWAVFASAVISALIATYVVGVVM